eukprot:scaffold152998_cov41-Tisochrysis_lutea.AAC.1
MVAVRCSVWQGGAGGGRWWQVVARVALAGGGMVEHGVTVWWAGRGRWWRGAAVCGSSLWRGVDSVLSHRMG